MVLAYADSQLCPVGILFEEYMHMANMSNRQAPLTCWRRLDSYRLVYPKVVSHSQLCAGNFLAYYDHQLEVFCSRAQAHYLVAAKSEDATLCGWACCEDMEDAMTRDLYNSSIQKQFSLSIRQVPICLAVHT